MPLFLTQHGNLTLMPCILLSHPDVTRSDSLRSSFYFFKQSALAYLDLWFTSDRAKRKETLHFPISFFLEEVSSLLSEIIYGLLKDYFYMDFKCDHHHVKLVGVSAKDPGTYLGSQRDMGSHHEHVSILVNATVYNWKAKWVNFI